MNQQLPPQYEKNTFFFVVVILSLIAHCVLLLGALDMSLFMVITHAYFIVWNSIILGRKDFLLTSKVPAVHNMFYLFLYSYRDLEMYSVAVRLCMECYRGSIRPEKIWSISYCISNRVFCSVFLLQFLGLLPSIPIRSAKCNFRPAASDADGLSSLHAASSQPIYSATAFRNAAKLYGFTNAATALHELACPKLSKPDVPFTALPIN